MLLVTHDLSFAEQNAHRWLLMAGGQVVAEGTPSQVMSDKAAMARACLESTESFRLFMGDDPLALRATHLGRGKDA